MQVLRWNDRAGDGRRIGHRGANRPARLDQGPWIVVSSAVRSHAMRGRCAPHHSPERGAPVAMMRSALSRERWDVVEPLLDTALELEPAQRSAFLDEACRGDQV